MIRQASWPLPRIADAFAQLARASGLPVRDAPVGEPPPSVVAEQEVLGLWLGALARHLGLEVDRLRVPYRLVAATLINAAPTLVLVGVGPNARLLAVLRGRGQTLTLLAPSGARVRATLKGVAAAVRSRLDHETSGHINALFDAVDVAPARRPRAKEALLDEVLGPRALDVGWSLALPSSAPFARQLRDAGVFASARRVVAMQLVQQALGLAGWWLVGRGALDGSVEPGWLAAWALVLLSAVLPRVAAAWTQGAAALGVATLLKRRMLGGALRADPEQVRRQGAGELLGRVIEAGALESLVTSGGLAALLAAVEVLVACAVLLLVPAGATLALAFSACVAATLALAGRVRRRTVDWTSARLAMTQDLVERMVGHRTRLAQEPRERWHEEEDQQLARYADRSARLDRATIWAQGAPARGWLVVGLLALAPEFVRGAASGAQLAVGLGGLLLGFRALANLTAGVAALARARVAWEQARPLFEVGGREERAGAPNWAALGASATAPVLADVRNVHFSYARRGEPVLRGIDLIVRPHDRVLLEGPSGGGKSTLGAILAGLRQPDTGLLLLGGLDHQTLGEAGWRRRVVAAPQFHENYLISSTLAFNLLMGRAWPPREEDVAEAREVCEDLGLGPLIERMPSGLLQMVGETGWQLSHGERSRVFIARALLQRADLIVLDESFAALDPETLEIALRCVLKRAPALVVIAHP